MNRLHAIALLVGLALAGCTLVEDAPNRLSSFEVTLEEGMDRGTEESPLSYATGRSCGTAGLTCDDGEVCKGGQCSMAVRISVAALTPSGEVAKGFNGPVRIDVTPGTVPGEESVLFLEDGVADDVEVFINRSMGKTHVWVEQDGFEPKPDGVLYGECNDGEDNDGNGLIDMADPGCLNPEDDREQRVTLSSGTSEQLTFSYPTIREIQYTETSLSSTPLQYEQVTVPGGRKVVVNVVANGFYVADLADQDKEKPFNGIFVFTFSKPKGVEYGDIICQFSGSLEEHVGMTQVVFPSFVVRDPDNPACLADEDISGFIPPAPVDVLERELILDEYVASSSLAEDNHTENCRRLERFESTLIRFSDLAVSTRYVKCDRNGNGTIDGGVESTCRSVCQDDPLCTDLEGYFEYSQWAGLLGGRKKVYASVALADQFKPLAIDFIGEEDQNGLCTYSKTPQGFDEYMCPPRTLESVTGSLRHIHLCSASETDARCGLQFWVLDPRFNGDVVIGDTTDMDQDGVTIEAGDCNDNNIHQSPNVAEEPANGIDDNCDGEIDEEA